MKSLLRVETLPLLAVGLAAWCSALVSARELIDCPVVLLGHLVG